MGLARCSPDRAGHFPVLAQHRREHQLVWALNYARRALTAEAVGNVVLRLREDALDACWHATCRAIYGEFLTVNAQLWRASLRNGYVFSAIFPVLNVLAGSGRALVAYLAASSTVRCQIATSRGRSTERVLLEIPSILRQIAPSRQSDATRAGMVRRAAPHPQKNLLARSHWRCTAD